MSRAETDRVGRVYGLTWPAPLRPWGPVGMRLLSWAARHIPWVTGALRRMALIRGGYWTVLTHAPDSQGRRQRLRQPILLFEANFDVDLARYIEVFAEAIRWRFRCVWGSAIGYPGVLPSDGFLAWVEEHRTRPSHSWCAYPESTTRMVRSALRVAEQLRHFEAEVDGLDDKAFAAAFKNLLTNTANDL